MTHEAIELANFRESLMGLFSEGENLYAFIKMF